MQADPQLTEVARLHRYVRADHPHTADPRALEITGYDPRVLRPGEVDLETALAELSEMAWDTSLAAHKVRYDGDFLSRAYRRAGFCWPFSPRLTYCTLQMLAPLYALGRLRSVSLRRACLELLDLELPETHDAMSDVEASLALARLIWPRYRSAVEGL